MKATNQVCCVCITVKMMSSVICHECIERAKRWSLLNEELEKYNLTSDNAATMIREYVIRELENCEDDEEIFEYLPIDLSKDEANELVRDICDHIAFFSNVRANK